MPPPENTAIIVQVPNMNEESSSALENENK
jgi:hypothetical protein